MKTIDYLSYFLLLGAAPTWQGLLDHLSPGLGTSLVVLFVLAGLKIVRGEIAGNKPHRSTSASISAAASSGGVVSRARGHAGDREPA